RFWSGEHAAGRSNFQPTTASGSRYRKIIEIEIRTGAGKGDRLRQRISAAGCHREAERVHLLKYIWPYNGTYRDRASVTRCLECELTAISPCDEASIRQKRRDD